MGEPQRDMVKYEANALMALRVEFRSAIDQVTRALADVNRRGYLAAPWLGDETSAEVAAHYTRRAMDDPDSSYHALISYRDELTRIHDTLLRMEDAYRRGEDAEAVRWRAGV